MYVRFRTIAFSTHLTDAEAKIFQETEEYFGDKDYKRIEELIQKIPTAQARHIAITLYHDLYPYLNVLLSLSPTQLEQLLLLLAPHDLPFQDNIKNLYSQRLDYKRGIRANDCALLIQHILPLTNWSLTAKKALAECYFLLVLIKEEQFGFLDPNKQVTIYESLFFETVIPYVRHLSHSSVLKILDQTHASLSQILEFHGERNTLIGLLRNCSNAQGIENLFQEKRKEMQWLNSYQNSQEFYQSIKEFHDFFNQLSEVENPLQFNLLAAQRQSKEVLLWQKLNLLRPLAKPLVHAAFVGNYASLKDNFAFPSFCLDSALPLHNLISRKNCNYV